MNEKGHPASIRLQKEQQTILRTKVILAITMLLKSSIMLAPYNKFLLARVAGPIISNLSLLVFSRI